MAGFEVIVRPMILPGIRPAQVARVPSPGDADQSLVVLSGGGGSMINLTISTSYSMSRSKMIEKKRKYNVERIYEQDTHGTLNRDSYIDLERLTHIWYGGSEETEQHFADPPKRDNVEVKETGQVRNNPKAPQE